MISKNVRVRIAPSPTGIPHIGNTRTALFNYLFAKHFKGSFLLRIEDTDQKRIVAGATEAILEILEWLGLMPDEICVQSERLELYRKASQFLLEHNFARKEEGAVRFVVSKERQTVEWEDAIGGKKISFKTKDIEDFIILKSDGFPTYHLASVVDDHDTEISHVIRGEEWISSTPKHILLYKALEWDHPVFAHLPIILGPDKSKLSKRHGAQSVLYYRDQGYLKEALLNFMALLGWNPGGDKEIMSLDEMVSLFDLKDVNTANPVFDRKKLDWMNGVYIRQAKPDELKSKIKNQKSKSPIRQAQGRQLKIQKLDEEMFDRLIPLAQTRMSTLNDFYALVAHFFEEPKIKLDANQKEIAKHLIEVLSSVSIWTKDVILATLIKLMRDQKIRMPVFYYILTGKESGLPLPESLDLLGKAKTIKRLKKLL